MGAAKQGATANERELTQMEILVFISADSLFKMFAPKAQVSF
jgi:hypothetical protein